jgi:hypothetical protein
MHGPASGLCGTCLAATLSDMPRHACMLRTATHPRLWQNPSAHGICRFEPGWARIVGGTDEGVYGWIGASCAFVLQTPFLTRVPLPAQLTASRVFTVG